MSPPLIQPQGGGPAKSIRETSGPTVLTLGAVADGEYLKRSGSTVVGAAVSSALPEMAARIASSALSDAFVTFPGVSAYVGGTGLSTGQLRAKPIVFGRSGTLSSIGLICSSGVSNAKARIGLYEAGSDGYPSSLVAESAELDCSTNTRKLTTGLSVAIVAGKAYWVAFLGGTAAPNLAHLNTALNVGTIVAASGATSATNIVGITVAQAYGALPSTFPAGAVGTSNSNVIPVPLLGVS